MTLIVAADIQDHLMLAGDHCAVLSQVSNRSAAQVVVDHYRKVNLWKYGAISASGDVFLMQFFHQVFLGQERSGLPIDLLEVAREAKEMRTRIGIDPSRSSGNIFLTLPGHSEFSLHAVFVGENSVDCEVIEPISARFSMRRGLSRTSTYDNFVSRLRPAFFFKEIDEFHRYHVDLLRQFFLQHSVLDDWITASFDVYFLEKRTGMGTLQHVSETPKALRFVSLLSPE